MGIFLSIEEHNLNLQEVHWEQRFISLVNCPAALGGVGERGRWQQPGGVAVQGRVPTKMPGSKAQGSLSMWESESCWVRGLCKLSLLLPPGRPACIFLFLRSNYFQQNWDSHPLVLR